MRRRLRSWARTLFKLVLLILCYFWIGAAYKLVYAQTHDITRFQGKIPLPYYQQQFILDSLLGQTWMFGPDFRQYLGELPSIGALLASNPQAVLADYCRTRERELTELPDRFAYSLFAEEALDDAYFYSQGASLLGVFGAREQPRLALAGRNRSGAVRTIGLPDFSRATELSRRLADGYPDSPQAPRALLRAADAQAREVDPSPARATYRRIALEYPRAPETEEAANALSRMAAAEGKMAEALRYKRQALDAAESTARRRAAGSALPADTSITVMGYRIDLSTLFLRMSRVQPAADNLALAARLSERIQTLRLSDERLETDFERRREHMDAARSELWVAELFETLKVGMPGPPPRPKEQPVSGRVQLEGKPLEGVVVVLSAAPLRERPMGAAEDLGNDSRYRAVTDRAGRYVIPGVPAGVYFPQVVHPLRPESLGGAVMTVASGMEQVRIGDKPVTLPLLRFRKALGTRTFGEVPPTGKSVRLEWDPWPGAAKYRVRLLAPVGGRALFQGRFPEEKRREFRRSGILWTAEARETRADVPLLELAPDVPQATQFMQYEYEIAALDAAGKELASSLPAMSRFHLSQAARNALMDLDPPTREGGFGRRRERRSGPERPRPPAPEGGRS